MATIVIMPGGFHPFHPGHLSLYNQAREAFPDAEVFVAATDDTSTRPFPFAVKEKLAQLAGVAPAHFFKVKSPFKAEEITKKFNPNRDVLIFVRSDKDKNKPPQPGGIKKDGSLAYLQPLEAAQSIEPFSQHAYMAYLRTEPFADGMKGATDIRNEWPTLDAPDKIDRVHSLYPKTQSNKRLTNTVVKMLDTAILGAVNESSRIIQPKVVDIFVGRGFDKPQRLVAKQVPYELFDKYVAKVIEKYPNFKPTDFSFRAAESDVNENQGWAATLQEIEGEKLDLTKNFGNHERVIAQVEQILPSGKYLLRVLTADVAQGRRPTLTVGQTLSIAPNYLRKVPRLGSTVESDMQMAGTPAVGGMTANYQRRENQPIDEDYIDEKWSAKYKRSINCARPRGFSQRAHCAGRDK